ncbi:MAG: NAD(P)/FAD-dependent oxidoreductase [Candidatus Omnitrophica bacterium]|nr:NAD(P)/FAD-dependent oxidoreductase [Candidatus Omnitrophota bacterium]
MKYDAIIIGAGIGGLICALKLSKSGKKILLLEKQGVPGGFATSFRRKGFTFESSLHVVDALNPDGEIRKFLDESGISNQVNYIDLDYFARIIYPEHNFIVNCSCKDFISYLKYNFPHESSGIDKAFLAINKFNKQFDRFYELNLPLWLKFALTPLISPQIILTSMISTEQFLGKFIKDKKLLALFTDIWRFLGLPPSRLSAFYFLIIFRGYYENHTAYIKGGFSKLFEAIISELKKEGSEVRFNTEVKKISIGNNKQVKSVITKNNEEFFSDAVVSNANAIDTLTNFIDDNAQKNKYLNEISGLEKSISAFQVYLGLSKPAKDLGMGQYVVSLNKSYDQDENFSFFTLENYDSCSLELVDHSQIDPGLVPSGKGSLLIMILADYSSWKNLSEEKYKQKKDEVAKKLIKRAEQFLPGLTNNIEVMEVATPLTMERYVSSPQGAIYGFSQSVSQSSINRLPQKTRIKGLFLAGAWTQPGHGMHGCFVSGIEAADSVLRYLKG